MQLARTAKMTGAIIRRQRKRLKLTQTELGERCGRRQETISLIEAGNAAMRLDTLLAVLAALDLELQVAPRSKREFGDDLEERLEAET
ncbi:MAG: helix-turn-helix transcriptional regulator [Hyphomicrobiales bacterium]|nr:helix-turn-helix transcriptional regulator [Hyphomicrobiales bacterium]